MSFLYVNNYKFSETAIKNYFGIYKKNNVFYTKFGELIRFPEKYLKACLVNKYRKERENTIPLSKADKIKEYCEKNNLKQDQFGIYKENGQYYTCLGEPIYNLKKYIETCLKNKVQKDISANPFMKFNDISEEKITFFSGNYNEIKEIIKEILKKGYNYSDIVVLAKGKGNIEFIYNHLSYSLQEHCVKNIENQENNILITTYSSNKNFDKKIYIFADFDSIDYNLLSFFNLTYVQHLYLHTKNNNPSMLISKIKENLRK